MIRPHAVAVVLLFGVLLPLGCASHQRKTAGEKILEAEAAIRSAKLVDAHLVAPDRVAQAERYYRSARETLSREPLSDSLRAYLAEENAIAEKAVSQAQLARREAELAIRIAHEESRRRSSLLQSQNDALGEKVTVLQSQLRSLKQDEEASGQTQQGPESDALYVRAFYLFHDAQYAASREAFRKFLNKSPRHRLAPNAHYWIGECYYAQRNYAEAGKAFETVLRDFGSSLKVPDSLLKLGMCNQRLGEAMKSVQNWRTLLERYPKSRAAAIAGKYLVQ